MRGVLAILFFNVLGKASGGNKKIIKILPDNTSLYKKD
jgi:hypothetical protein